MPKVEAAFTNSTALKATTLSGLAADIGQTAISAAEGDTFGTIKNSGEAGLGVLGTAGAFNLYRYLPSRYRSIGRKIDSFLDWTIPIQGISSLF